MRWGLALAAFCLAFGLAGCGNKTRDYQAEIDAAKVTTTTLEEGDSSIVFEEGDKGWLYYRGTLAENGVEFDSNMDEDGAKKPYAMIQGSSPVIEGWHRGVLGMTLGEKRKLEIPSILGYGPMGSPNIPPNADLVFDVELIYLQKKEDLENDEAPYDIEEISEGTGPTAELGDTVTIHYRGTYLDGEMWDDTRERGETVTFPIGGAVVITGVDDAVRGMKVGGKRKAILPPELVYGPGGGPSIQGDQPVIVEMELISVEKAA